MDLELRALVEPMAVAWHAVRRSGVAASHRVLLIGAGTIGIGLWFPLRAQGVTDVVMSEISASRRDVAAGLGATVLDPVSAGALAEAAGHGSGGGFDALFDNAGGAAAWADALAHLSTDAVVVVMAIHSEELALQPLRLVLDETCVIGTLAYLPEDFDAVIAAMDAGRLRHDRVGEYGRPRRRRDDDRRAGRRPARQGGGAVVTARPTLEGLPWT